MRGFPSDTDSNVTVSGDCIVPGGAVINVTGNVYVAPGAVINSELAPSTITGGRNVTGTNTGSFLLNGATVKGNVTFSGGGSDMIPWSIKNNTINGNLTVTEQTRSGSACSSTRSAGTSP